ncbi:MAG: hypothetical protein IJG51_07720 [Synergistaceae bacterium]|nr:hypothetical protein [Synergistaceae bacterium]MBQ3346984.1 hypothetical protein [Synergistaceae bacterium]MBQ3398760.1 hypothetical protein [Synergistaceae bacterium]MBQ6417287.1 hypothetical protein [Synergistaceae bacterium]MBQ6665611.1 hypothetical protein [Synergistaceae bacterium]
MITNTASTLSKGMEILAENMGIVEAERFVFLIKSEHFDYTEWQRNYFDNIPPEQLDADISKYFEAHKDSFPNAVRL